MTLRAVKPGQVEITRQIQDVQVDPVLKRVARQPHRSGTQHCEAVAKASS
jgi:hypothetical protein